MVSVQTAQAATVRCLLVQAGDHLCAIPLAAIRRVVKALLTNPLPGAAPELTGLAEFGGEPLPVLDLARLVGAAPGSRPAYPVTIVVWGGARDAHELVGLAADAAIEIFELSLAGVVHNEGHLVRAETTYRGGPIRLLDVGSLGNAS